MVNNKLTVKRMNEIKGQLKKAIERADFSVVQIMVYQNDIENGEISSIVKVNDNEIDLIEWHEGFTKEQAIKEAIKFSEHIENMMKDFILEGIASFNDAVEFEIWR